jgi:SAM-dependent methyltransferase
MTSEPRGMQRVDRRCPACDARPIWRLLSIEQAPAHVGVLWSDRRSAVHCPKGDISLCYCAACGFVTNAAFEPLRVTYEEGYDNALDFSAVFQDYARALADDLIARYDLRVKDVVEIGCGMGDFLELLCERGGNRGVGFDPSAPESGRGVEFVRDLYTRRYRDRPADLIVCRQVFEHVHEPVPFLSELRATIGERATPVFFEVPNIRNITRELSVWDIIYEHCSYFGVESLSRVFARCGFVVEEVVSLYEDQFLGLHARPSGDDSLDRFAKVDLQALAREVEGLSGAYESRLREWRARLSAMEENGRSCVVWGAGARGTSFANLLDSPGRIRCFVDINPRKHGKYVPGSGQEIVAPERLRQIRPDVVVVMNPLYLEEIAKSVEDLGVSAEVVPA